MRNLAGDKRSNASIHDELEAAEIEIVEVPEPYGEPHATLIGKLGPFTFRRAWYYWLVEGPVPVAVAMELYEHPIGRKYVRVGGHCGCPSPLDYGARWIRRLLSHRQRARAPALRRHHSEARARQDTTSNSRSKHDSRTGEAMSDTKRSIRLDLTRAQLAQIGDRVLVVLDHTPACSNCHQSFTEDEQRDFCPSDNDVCPKCGAHGMCTTWYGDPQYELMEHHLGDPYTVFVETRKRALRKP